MSEPAQVRVRLPAALGQIVGVRSLELRAPTVRDALDALIARHPELAVHLFDETGAFRRHVLCFHNERTTRARPDLAIPLRDGDVVTLMQAVSGGR